MFGTSTEYVTNLEKPILNDICEYIDDDCKNNCVVYVDGKYDVNLSTLKDSSIFSSLSELDEEEISKISPLLTSLPEASELPRNCLGSDIITLKNLVIEIAPPT